MQTTNINVPLRVTGRHVAITEALHQHVEDKLAHLHLDYPRIIEAHVILDVQKHRQYCEIILSCANHISIEASAETTDMYAAIEGATDKIAAQMRKHKTRLLRSHRARPRGELLHLEEQVLETPADTEEPSGAEPTVVQTERYPVKPMYVEEAVLQMQMSERQFVVFLNAKSRKVNILHRRKDGGFGLMEPASE